MKKERIQKRFGTLLVAAVFAGAFTFVAVKLARAGNGLDLPELEGPEAAEVTLERDIAKIANNLTRTWHLPGNRQFVSVLSHGSRVREASEAGVVTTSSEQDPILTHFQRFQRELDQAHQMRRSRRHMVFLANVALETKSLAKALWTKPSGGGESPLRIALSSAIQPRRWWKFDPAAKELNRLPAELRGPITKAWQQTQKYTRVRDRFSIHGREN